MIKEEDSEDSNNHILNQNKAYKKRIKKIANKKQNQRSGHWDQDQKIKYIIFLQLHKDKFQIKQQRRYLLKQLRTQKIFKIMSNIICTRTPDQCRSHHQKMQKHHNQIQNIIEHYKSQIIPQKYEIQYEKFINTYCKNQSDFKQFDESLKKQKIIPIVTIPKKTFNFDSRSQQGFQLFGNPSNQNNFQFHILHAIYQIYSMCFPQDTKNENQIKKV